MKLKYSLFLMLLLIQYHASDPLERHIQDTDAIKRENEIFYVRREKQSFAMIS
jgi:hypothetical protein